MEVPALSGASGASVGVEGKIESVQDGKASVKLSGGALVLIPVDREFPSGTLVTVKTASDGTLQLTLRGPDVDLAKLRESIWNTLRSLVGGNLATELSVPLARGDFATAARSLPPAGAPATAVPESVESGPIFLSEASATPPPRGDAVLSILSKVEQNLYAAEFAGQPQELFGPLDVEPATRMLARAQPLPGGGSVWTPTPSSAGEPIVLPERIQAGSTGARELLRWAGVPQASQMEVDDLGKALANAATALLDDAYPSQTETVQNPPEDGMPAEVQENMDRSPAVPIPLAQPTTDKTRQPAVAGSSASVTAPVEASLPSPAQIPSNVAIRVLAAWSLDLPAAETVRRASLLQTGEEIPQVLASLEKLVQERPGRHPALEVALQSLREGGKLPPGTLADGPRHQLEAAVLEALVRETSSDGDPKPLRQAAESLLADRLPERSPGAENGQTFWASSSTGWEKARIVVRDERERKGRSPAGADFHAVDVAMDPVGMGKISARLELRGHILTTRLEAADPATVDLLRRKLPELSAALSKLGLDSGALDVRRKSPTVETQPRKRGAGGSIDVRA